MTRTQAIVGFRKARALLVRGWIQHADALTAFGKPCDPKSRWARMWCLNGALLATGFNGATVQGLASSSGDALTRWNDAPNRRLADVLACIDNSIAALDSK